MQLATDQLREALRRHRLSRGFSFEELSTDIALVVGRKHRMSLWTVKRFIDGDTDLNERNRYTVETYLNQQVAA